MGVEPTGDRAERPPSRFEDGETHRDLYTSMESYRCLCRLLWHSWPCLSSEQADTLYIDLGQVFDH